VFDEQKIKMQNQLYINFFPALLLLTPMFICLGTLYVWKYLRDRQKRRSPLTTELIRQPAHGLRDELDNLTFDLSSKFAIGMFLPTYFLFFHVWKAWISGYDTLWKGAYLTAILIVVSLIWAIREIVKILNHRTNLLNATNAEIAVAQELEVLKAHGCKIYHDIQAKGFNIDHVLVGPRGVFAIETKSRLKPDSGNKKEDARVEFDGNVLKFPGWVEKRPLEQARAQAKWLQERLSKSVGEPVKVFAVLALPGWFVDRKGRSDIYVFNPKNNSWLIGNNQESALDQSKIQRISFQLEQLSKIEQ
jgi:hypothetical protein